MRDSVRKDIETAVQVLREAGAKEIYVFGSAAEGTDTPDSDIDLAVRGLPPDRFFEAVGRVAMVVSERFDLIDIDESTPFTEFLERKGKLLRVA